MSEKIIEIIPLLFMIMMIRGRPLEITGRRPIQFSVGITKIHLEY